MERQVALKHFSALQVQFEMDRGRAVGAGKHLAQRNVRDGMGLEFPAHPAPPSREVVIDGVVHVLGREMLPVFRADPIMVVIGGRIAWKSCRAAAATSGAAFAALAFRSWRMAAASSPPAFCMAAIAFGCSRPPPYQASTTLPSRSMM